MKPISPAGAKPALTGPDARAGILFTSLPVQRLASSTARPDNAPDESCQDETRKGSVASRSGSGERVSQADSRERPAIHFRRVGRAVMQRIANPSAGRLCRNGSNPLLSAI